MAVCTVGDKIFNNSHEITLFMHNSGLIERDGTIKDIEVFNEFITSNRLNPFVKVQPRENGFGVSVVAFGHKAFQQNIPDGVVDLKSISSFKLDRKSKLEADVHSLNSEIRRENISEEKATELIKIRQETLKEIEKTDRDINQLSKILFEEQDAVAVVTKFLSDETKSISRLLSDKKLSSYMRAQESLDMIRSFSREVEDGLIKGIEPGSELSNILAHYLGEASKNAPIIKRGLEESVQQLSEVMANPDRVVASLRRELSEGLDDIDLASSFILDPTTSINGSQSVIPAIMMKKLTDELSVYESKSLKLNNEVDRSYAAAKKYIKDTPELSFLMADGIRIGGEAVLNDKMFLEKDEFGNYTDNVVSKYSQKWYRDQKNQYNRVRTLLTKEVKTADERNKNARAASRQTKEFYKKSADFIDPSKVSDPEYVKGLQARLGKRQTDIELKRVAKKEKSYQRHLKVVRDSYAKKYSGQDLKDAIAVWEDQNDPKKLQAFLSKKGFNHQFDTRYVTSIPKDLGYYFNDTYSKLESHAPAMDLLSAFQDSIDFKNQENSKFGIVDHNNSVYITQEAMRTRVLKLILEGKWSMVFEMFTGLFKDGKLLNSILKSISHNLDDVSYAKRDYRTGRYNAKVNKSFLKSNNGKAEAQALLHRNKAGFGVNFYTGPISEEQMGYMHQLSNPNVPYERFKKAFHNTYPKGFSPPTFFKNLAIHNIVQDSTVNLPFLMKTQNAVTAQFAARQNILPEMLALKDQFDKLSARNTAANGKVELTETGTSRDNEGSRSNDIKRTDEWFSRAFLQEDTKKHRGVIPTKPIYEDIETATQVEKLIKEKEGSLTEEDMDSLKDYLAKTRRTGTFSDVVYALIEAARFTSMGFSLRSGMNNLIEGSTTLMTQSAYFHELGLLDMEKVMEFSPDRLIGAAAASKMRKLTKNTNYNNYDKIKQFVSNHDVIEDMANIIQKSAGSGSVRDQAIDKVFDPYTAIRKGEHANQYSLIAALLSQREITGKTGQLSNVWDETFMNEEGKLELTEEFDTLENRAFTSAEIESTRASKEYKDFRSLVSVMMAKTQGDFRDIGGMRLRTTEVGQAFALFRSWMPAHFEQWFARQSYNALLDRQIGGSFARGGSSAALAGLAGTMGLMAHGGVAGGIAAVGAYAYGRYKGGSDASTVEDLIAVLEGTAKRAANIPLSLMSTLTGGKIPTFDGTRITSLGNRTLSEIYGTDSNASASAAALISRLGNTLAMLTAYSIIMSVLYKDDFGDDDEEEKRFKRLINQATNLYSQNVSFIDPKFYLEDVTKTPVASYANNLIGLASATSKLVTGDSINPRTGNNVLFDAGSKFLPGTVRHTYGEDPSEQRVFQPLRIEHMWHGDEKIRKKRRRAERKAFKEQLESNFPELSARIIDRRVDSRFPY